MQKVYYLSPSYGKNITDILSCKCTQNSKIGQFPNIFHLHGWALHFTYSSFEPTTRNPYQNNNNILLSIEFEIGSCDYENSTTALKRLLSIRYIIYNVCLYLVDGIIL